MTGPQVTLSLEQYDALRKRAGELEAELARARAIADDARHGPDDSDVRRLADAFQRAMTIVQFAVATMDPLTVRGWPHAELVAIAAALPSLPAIGTILPECASQLRAFAELARSWEETRAAGKEQERLAAENAERGLGNALSMWGAPDEP